jgi:hypothetical protein
MITKTFEKGLWHYWLGERLLMTSIKEMSIEDIVIV